MCRRGAWRGYMLLQQALFAVFFFAVFFLATFFFAAFFLAISGSLKGCERNELHNAAEH